MRLRDWEIEAIKRSAAESFGDGVVVRLFGSRVDDSRKGGDIDLLISLPQVADDPEASARFRRLLDRRIGEREIDVVCLAPDTVRGRVHREALEKGVVL